ncbi:MAG: PEP/pyruvate-binding domain-containing protein [Desulfosarcinaceae bacterium]
MKRNGSAVHNIFHHFLKSRRKARGSVEGGLSQQKYRSFQSLLAANNRALGIITDLEDHFYQDKPFTLDYVVSRAEALVAEVFTLVEDLNALCGAQYAELFDAAEKIGVSILADLVHKKSMEKTDFVLPLEGITRDDAAAVGGKAANLGEVLNKVNLPVPPGFAVTAYACWHFLEKSGLSPFIRQQLKGLDVDDTERLTAVSRAIQERIMAAEPSGELRAALSEAADQLQDKAGPKLHLAVRSSATSEDGTASFAGQHTTVLNIAPGNLMPAYKEVVASTFNPRAIYYRIRKGYREQDVIMSVACIAMVDALASGVLYTVDPNDRRRGVMLISAVWGLAAHAVEGAISGDFFMVEKASGRILEQQIAGQRSQLRTDPQEGVAERPVPADQQGRACLQPDQIASLAECGRQLEGHYGTALDIEWAIDESGKLFVLQARPLKKLHRTVNTEGSEEAPEAMRPVPAGHPVLLQDGAPACEGAASGLAFVMESDHMLHHVPEGAIVVARETSPRYVPLMGRIQAMITDVGSVTGHMASVAREFRIPTLVGTRTGTRVIPHGEEITVDAGCATVYRGRVESLLGRRQPLNPMKNGPVYKAARKALQSIAPLNLTDHREENFTPRGCRTIHDIIRFAHEKAMQAMFRISDDARNEHSIAVPLRIQLPVNIYLIDLGGGLKTDRPAKAARLEDLTSIPLNALLEGMTDRKVQWSHDVGATWSDFASVLAGSLTHASGSGENMGGPNYALVSQYYLNLNSHLGYHFTTIDTYCGPVINDNYLTFHFKGGAADLARRTRRAALLSEILKRLGFKVELKMDLVHGRMKKYAPDQLAATLKMLGRLLGAVNLLDMVLSDDHQVQWYADEFFKGNYAFKPSGGNTS